jgi:hypothetical protein
MRKELKKGAPPKRAVGRTGNEGTPEAPYIELRARRAVHASYPRSQERMLGLTLPLVDPEERDM